MDPLEDLIGITKRDFFASSILNGMLANFFEEGVKTAQEQGVDPDAHAIGLVSAAYELADIMIAVGKASPPAEAD